MVALRDVFHGRGWSLIPAVLIVGFSTTGCSLLHEYRLVDREPLRNPQGHVVGKKETLRYSGTGEELTRIALFTPWRDPQGQISGYEERTRSGSIIRDLKGNAIGERWKDLRSRATNARSVGLTLVYVAPASRPGAAEGASPVETTQAPRPAGAVDYVRLASLHLPRE